MLNVLKYNNNSRKVIYDGYSLLMVAHTNELKNEQLEYFDGFIVDTDSAIHAKDIIKQIRSIKDVVISLLPVFINGNYTLPQNILAHGDGVVSVDIISTYIQKVTAIKSRIEKLTIPKTTNLHEINTYKILAYFFTRNKVLEPVTSRQSLIGYEFPFVSLLYKSSEIVTQLNLLNSLIEQKLLSFTLKDYVHLCKCCSGNYLNFREACPKCESIDIKAHDMVHHFVCAHVAPEKDFKTTDGLHCPKCDKHLRHIGIDYDKPSTIYSCNTCRHEFQNSSMKALCIDCNTEHALDELLEKTIGNYSLTQPGESFILSASESFNEKSEYSIGCISTPLFKLLLNQEIQRVKSTHCHSYFVKINFKSDQLHLLNTTTKKAVTQEISAIIKSYLKEADILTAQNFNCYYLMLPETKENQLARLENIKYNLAKLLNDNVVDTQHVVDIYLEKIATSSTIQDYFN